jgi:phosphomannomutase
MHYTHFFFDMDGTITPSRAKITPPMKAVLTKLLAQATVGVISGSHNTQMAWQIDSLPVIQMGQNGNHLIDPIEGELWFDTLTEAEKEAVYRHGAMLREHFTHEVPDDEDLLEDRGSQISFSIYGHHADPAAKKACDGDFKKRTALLAAVPFVSTTLEVRLGGSTTLDYFRKGRNKGYNISRLLAHKGWDPQECIFFGDALFPGGNDASVSGVIEAVPVTNEADCYQKLTELLNAAA